MLKRENHYARGFWGLAFVALGAAVALEESRWTLMLYAFGAAGALMLSGSACAAARGGLRLTFVAFAAAKLVGFTLWLQANRAWLVVQVDGGITLCLLAVLHALDWRSRSSRWILAGVVTTLAAELFHPVILAAAMVLCWRGVATMRDRRIQE